MASGIWNPGTRIGCSVSLLAVLAVVGASVATRHFSFVPYETLYEELTLLVDVVVPELGPPTDMSSEVEEGEFIACDKYVHASWDGVEISAARRAVTTLKTRATELGWKITQEDYDLSGEKKFRAYGKSILWVWLFYQPFYQEEKRDASISIRIRNKCIPSINEE